MPPRLVDAGRPGVDEVDRQMRAISRRSFLWAGAAMMGAFSGWKWLVSRRMEDGVPWPFRRALQVNENLARDYFSGSRLTPQFPASLAGWPRPNGDLGLQDATFNPKTWKLRVMGLADMSAATTTVDPPAAAGGTSGDRKDGNPAPADDKKGSGDAGASNNTAAAQEDAGEPAVLVTLAEIKKLPRYEMVTELKCIEGWSQVVRWAGARFSDFAAKYKPALGDDQQPLPYVSIETPDGGYYVGLDLESAMHPQTLLCYEMNGQPLTLQHGAPLRLVIPVKYGIKNIKRIGVIRFTSERPEDFWAERGYDWYSGH